MITNLYTALLKHPDTPKVYRDLRDYYQAVGLNDEAKAFTHLLKELFHELPDVNVSNTNPQRHR